jgi:hypothetical protein
VFIEKAAIEFLLLGTGKDMLRPPKEVREAFAREGVALDFMSTGSAVRTWAGRNWFTAGKHFFGVAPGLIKFVNRGGRTESGSGHPERFKQPRTQQLLPRFAGGFLQHHPSDGVALIGINMFRPRFRFRFARKSLC